MPSKSLPGAACAAASLAVGLLLAGCGDNVQKFPPACPGLKMLPDAADLTRYSSAGQDLTDLVADARIISIPARCDQSQPGTVTASLEVNMAVERGPAAHSDAVALPYFVAVMDGDRIVDRQDYSQVAKFSSNTNQALVTSQRVDFAFPVTKDKSAAAYTIFVGYELTPDELALNRKRGPR